MERMGDPLDRAFTLCCIIITLRASEAAAQCIVIGPVCLFLGVCVCLWVCYHDNSKLPHQTGYVGKGSDHLQLIKFWPSCAPGKGSVAGRNFWLRLTTPSAQCLHLLRALFSLLLLPLPPPPPLLLPTPPLLLCTAVTTTITTATNTCG